MWYEVKSNDSKEKFEQDEITTVKQNAMDTDDQIRKSAWGRLSRAFEFKAVMQKVSPTMQRAKREPSVSERARAKLRHSKCERAKLEKVDTFIGINYAQSPPSTPSDSPIILRPLRLSRSRSAGSLRFPVDSY